mmetsp:Transcript_17477/g.37781  ORF Transcript_17477/g.37781 Transcript_17477/m.37781 type:complete len:101 (-) Transcript_17477:306-608(-)
MWKKRNEGVTPTVIRRRRSYSTLHDDDSENDDESNIHSSDIHNDRSLYSLQPFEQVCINKIMTRLQVFVRALDRCAFLGYAPTRYVRFGKAVRFVAIGSR